MFSISWLVSGYCENKLTIDSIKKFGDNSAVLEMNKTNDIQRAQRANENLNVY